MAWGSKDQGLRVSAPDGQGSSCRDKRMRVPTRTLHLNLYMAHSMYIEETESFIEIDD